MGELELQVLGVAFVYQRKEVSRTISRVLYRWSASVHYGASMSVIYLRRVSPHVSIVLPSDVSLRLGRAALVTPVYMDFQPSGCTARMSPCGWWALTPPSHPYLLCVKSIDAHACSRRLFSSTLAGSREPLLIKKRSALCCPDFPLALHERKRQTVLLTFSLSLLYVFIGCRTVKVRCGMYYVYSLRGGVVQGVMIVPVSSFRTLGQSSAVLSRRM